MGFTVRCNTCQPIPVLQAALPIPEGLSLHELYARLPLDHLGTALLDSAAEPSPGGRFCLARYSIIAQEPFGVLEAHPNGVWWRTAEGSEWLTGDPLQWLQCFLNRYRLPAQHDAVPLPAGAVGFLNYGLKELLEPCPNRLPAVNRLPMFWFAFYDAIATVDLSRSEVLLTSSGLPETDANRHRRAQERLRRLQAQWERLLHQPPAHALSTFRAGEVQAIWSRREYTRALQKVKDYIADGHVYQVNLAQPFQAHFEGSPSALFLRARQISPAPFEALLRTDDFTILSLSPERFLHVSPLTRRVHTRPIKGTRPRGENPSEDRRLAEELRHSMKDRAEHIMIVDLERNDMGRVAQTGSVRVAELMALEGYAQVYHLTSTVEAVLLPEVDVDRLIRATFPGGSITGAPKVRAMQIIEELEPVAREVYTGAVGYIGFHGGLDLNVAIRTAVLRENKLTFFAGGGIVADSDAEAEYEETLAKARGWFETVADGGTRTNAVGVERRSTVPRK